MIFFDQYLETESNRKEDTNTVVFYIEFPSSSVPPENMGAVYH